MSNVQTQSTDTIVQKETPPKLYSVRIRGMRSPHGPARDIVMRVSADVVAKYARGS